MLIKKASSALILLLLAGPLEAAEINVLSAGAVEPGLHAAAEALHKVSGDEVKVRFATAPALLQRIGGGERADVLIAPPAVIEQLGKTAKVDVKSGISIGRVGVGVAVRQGAPIPDVSSVDALKRALLEAESVVYNQASTGNYVHGLLQRLGVADQLAKKTTRYPDGDAVMAHLLKGFGQEIGLGASTEIMLYTDKGLRLVGPLPSDVQNYTTYLAVPLPDAPNHEGGKKLLDYLGSPEAKQIFASKGIQ